MSESVRTRQTLKNHIANKHLMIIDWILNYYGFFEYMKWFMIFSSFIECVNVFRKDNIILMFADYKLCRSARCVLPILSRLTSLRIKSD